MSLTRFNMCSYNIVLFIKLVEIALSVSIFSYFALNVTCTFVLFQLSTQLSAKLELYFRTTASVTADMEHQSRQKVATY